LKVLTISAKNRFRLKRGVSLDGWGRKGMQWWVPMAEYQIVTTINMANVRAKRGYAAGFNCPFCDLPDAKSGFDRNSDTFVVHW